MKLTDEELSFFLSCRQIVGIDEVGRGPLAGPLVACAILLDIEQANELVKLGVNDSKKLATKKRERIDLFVREANIHFSIEEIPVDVIDDQGIYKATCNAIPSAYNKLETDKFAIIDGLFNRKFPIANYETRVSADKIFVSVATASVIAKVYRDNLMAKLDSQYPEYGFSKHKGYGTKQHIAAIKKYGGSNIHRKSFEPLKSLQR